MAQRDWPGLVPVLSRGKHRNPRKGACFMEYASFLAGERWSDHPGCTHPLIAGVARGVNDQISDDGRSRLVRLIPSIVGLTGDEPVVEVAIAMRCAAIALPVVAEHRQRALAAGLLSARRVLADLDPGDHSGVDTMELLEHSRRALATAPRAAEWAEDFTHGTDITEKAFRRRSAPAMVRISIVGIAEACIPDRDDLLTELLTTVIADCAGWLADDSDQHRWVHRTTPSAASVRPVSRNFL